MKIAGLMLLLLFLFSCAPLPQEKQGIKVVVSFYPLQFLAEEIGGQYIVTSSLVPTGVGIHDWEPTPRDIASLQDADIFIYNGVGEFWQDTVLNTLPSSTLVVKTSKDLPLLKIDGDISYDPHAWLDPLLMQRQVDAIMKALLQRDPDHKDYYENNAASLKQRLAVLDSEFRQGLSDCKKDTIITSHLAFTYVADRYGFKQIAASGVFHEEEPSAETIVELIKTAKEKRIRYIMFETLLSPKLSQTIAREIGGEALPLNPIEGLTEDEASRGITWFDVQKENIKNLKLAMECS